jgi:uncharacterized membrane protein
MSAHCGRLVKSTEQRAMNLISRTLLRGAILLLPALITLWLLWTALAGLDQFGAALLRLADWEDPAPGAGLVLIVVLMIVSGALIPINPMSWLFDRIEDWFMRFPLIKTVYGATRDFVRLMDKDAKKEFKQTVLVDVPASTMPRPACRYICHSATRLAASLCSSRVRASRRSSGRSKKRCAMS